MERTDSFGAAVAAGPAIDFPEPEQINDPERAAVIVAAIERAFALEDGALRASTRAGIRDRHFVGARNVAAYLLQRECGCNYTAIAEIVGWRDHNSARYALTRATEEVHADPDGLLSKVIGKVSEFATLQLGALGIAPTVDEERLVMPQDAPKKIAGRIAQI